MEPKLKIEGNKFYKRIEKIYKLWKSEVNIIDLLIKGFFCLKFT